jgi:hypothetical protein
MLTLTVRNVTATAASSGAASRYGHSGEVRSLETTMPGKDAGWSPLLVLQWDRSATFSIARIVPSSVYVSV